MKTTIGEERHFRIYLIKGEDENGLIPRETSKAMVNYDSKGTPVSIYFSSEKLLERVPEEPEDTFEERMNENRRKRREEDARLNPSRSPDEIVNIVNALEKALEK